MLIALLIWSSFNEHIDASSAGGGGSDIDAVMVDPGAVVSQYNRQQNQQSDSQRAEQQRKKQAQQQAETQCHRETLTHCLSTRKERQAHKALR